MKLGEDELLRYASAASQCGMQITPSLHFKLSAENIGKEQAMNVTELAAQIQTLLGKEKIRLHELLEYTAKVSGEEISPQDITRIGGQGRLALRDASIGYLNDYLTKPDSAPIQHFNFDFSAYTQDSATKTILEEALQKANQAENTTTVVSSDMSTDISHAVVEDDEDEEDFDDGEDDDSEEEPDTGDDLDFEDFTSDADEGDESEVDDFEEDEDEDFEDEDEEDEEDEDEEDFDETVFDHMETNDYLSGPFMAVEDALPFSIKTRLALVIDFSVVCPRDVLKDLRRVETDDGVIDYYNAFSAPSDSIEGGYAMLGLDSTVEILQKFNSANTVYIGSQDTLLPAAATTAANIALCIERAFSIMSGLDSAEDIVNNVHTQHNLFDVSHAISADVDTDIPEIVMTFFLNVRSQNVTSLDKLNRAKSRINQLLLEKGAHDVPVEIYAAVNASTLLENDTVRLVARSLGMLTEIQLNDLIESRLDALDLDFTAMLADEDEDFDDESDDDINSFMEDDSEDADENEDDIFPLASLESSVIAKYLPNDTSMVAHIISLNTGYEEDEDEEDYEEDAE